MARNRKTIYRLHGFWESDVSRLRARANETTGGNVSKMLRYLIRKGKITKADLLDMNMAEGGKNDEV